MDISNMKLEVEVLGDFALIYGKLRISEQIKRSSKTWKVLQYLLTHRNNVIPQEELIETFCDADAVDNPGSALRTLIYRVRAVLSETGLPFKDDMIVSKSGGYIWNQSIECIVDAERFEALCKQVANIEGESERLDVLLGAIALYKGDFLPNSTDEIWVIPVARWYRSLYIGCVHDALAILDKRQRYAEAEELCIKALTIDKFDERLIEFHLKAMIGQGNYADALVEYQKMENMYYDTLGIEFPGRLRALYSQIQRPAVPEGVALDTILDGWLEGAGFSGAFYCDLSVLKTMYQIEVRSVPRSGRTAYMVRIDTKHEPAAKGGGVMKQLADAIPVNLRMGDLFTRSAPNQYILMLYSLTYENCKDLINRILHSLDSKHLPKVINTTIKPVKPIF